MSPVDRYVLFSLDAGRFALDLDVVERVVPALEVTPLPNAPDIVLGVFNLQGRIIPVMNTRRRLGRPEREMAISDHLIVAKAAGRSVALLVDDTTGMIERASHEIVRADAILPDLPQVSGVIRFPDGIVLIHDLGRFLSLEEARKLDAVMAEAVQR